MGLAFAALNHYLPPAASRHSFAPFGLRLGGFFAASPWGKHRVAAFGTTNLVGMRGHER